MKTVLLSNFIHGIKLDISEEAFSRLEKGEPLTDILEEKEKSLFRKTFRNASRTPDTSLMVAWHIREDKTRNIITNNVTWS